MRKVNVLEFVSLDGVIQAPGGPEEDTSGGFAYGGWISPHSDPVLSTAIRKQMNMPFDLLIGRRTFDIWAPYWPQHNDIWPAVNTATKYVTSSTMTSHEWQPSVFLNGDIAEKITKIKQQEGPDLHVYGSANLTEWSLSFLDLRPLYILTTAASKSPGPMIRSSRLARSFTKAVS